MCGLTVFKIFLECGVLITALRRLCGDKVHAELQIYEIFVCTQSHGASDTIRTAIHFGVQMTVDGLSDTMHWLARSRIRSGYTTPSCYRAWRVIPLLLPLLLTSSLPSRHCYCCYHDDTVATTSGRLVSAGSRRRAVHGNYRTPSRRTGPPCASTTTTTRASVRYENRLCRLKNACPAPFFHPFFISS